MREISFKFGSREKGWKFYNCTEKESNWDKQRETLYNLGGNMHHWTYPKEDINAGRKNPVELEGIPMGMDFTKCNYKKLCKKLNTIVRDMPEENFPEDMQSTNFYWELTIENYETEKTDIPCLSVKKIKNLRMWRGANYEPQKLQEIKECFANYYRNK